MKDVEDFVDPAWVNKQESSSTIKVSLEHFVWKKGWKYAFLAMRQEHIVSLIPMEHVVVTSHVTNKSYKFTYKISDKTFSHSMAIPFHSIETDCPLEAIFIGNKKEILDAIGKLC